MPLLSADGRRHAARLLYRTAWIWPLLYRLYNTRPECVRTKRQQYRTSLLRNPGRATTPAGWPSGQRSGDPGTNTPATSATTSRHEPRGVYPAAGASVAGGTSICVTVTDLTGESAEWRPTSDDRMIGLSAVLVQPAEFGIRRQSRGRRPM